MKTCPKCGELNGNSLSECFKCGASLPKDESKKYYAPDEKVWVGTYIIAFLIPVVGGILSAAYSKHDDDTALYLKYAAILGAIFLFILKWLI